MSIFKKLSAFLTAVGIACSCAACGYNTINALTVDGVQIPAGVYIYYANSAYNQALSKLAEENPDLDTTDTAAVKASTLEGKDVLTWVQDEATKSCSQYVVTEKKFEEYGLEFDEETKSTLSMMKEYYWEGSKESFEKNGISEASFEKIITSSYKSDLIFEHIYGVDGENGTTEQEVYDYYKDNNIRCEYLGISLKDGEGNLLKSDGKAEMMEMAKGYQKRIEEALADGGIDAVKAEMDAIRVDYAEYTASLTAEETEEDLALEEETLPETEEETAADTTEAEDTTAEETDAETEAATGSEVVEAETFNTSADSEAETDEDASEETTEETDAETTEEETAAEETDETAEDETAEDETAEETTEVETEVASNEDDLLEITAEEEETDPFVNESIISVINEADYDDPNEIYYNPSEKTYKQLLEIKPEDYGKLYIVEEDETYYLAIRYDIEDRMNEDDLWTDATIDNTVYTMFSEDFEDLLDSWTETVTVVRNEAAYKRYDPFKFDFS